MSNMNKVILIGNLGSDAVLRHTGKGRAVINIRMATNHFFTDEGGKRHHKPEWHNITIWGKRAENCSEFLTKGRRIYVEGYLSTHDWKDKEGVARSTTEVVAQKIQFLFRNKKKSDQMSFNDIPDHRGIKF